MIRLKRRVGLYLENAMQDGLLPTYGRDFWLIGDKEFNEFLVYLQ